MRIPAKVTHEITADKCVTKIFDQDEKLIGTLINKRVPGGFSRKTMAFEKKYPDFMCEVDGFHCTDVADQLRDFSEDCHADLEELT